MLSLRYLIHTDTEMDCSLVNLVRRTAHRSLEAMCREENMVIRMGNFDVPFILDRQFNNGVSTITRPTSYSRIDCAATGNLVDLSCVNMGWARQ